MRSYAQAPKQLASLSYRREDIVDIARVVLDENDALDARRETPEVRNDFLDHRGGDDIGGQPPWSEAGAKWRNDDRSAPMTISQFQRGRGCLPHDILTSRRPKRIEHDRMNDDLHSPIGQQSGTGRDGSADREGRHRHGFPFDLIASDLANHSRDADAHDSPPVRGTNDGLGLMIKKLGPGDGD